MVSMEGLQFQVVSTTDEAVKGIDNLIAKFESLKKTISGGAGFKSYINNLQKLANALNGPNNIGQIEKLSTSLQGLASARIPQNLATQIRRVGAATKSITPDAVLNVQQLTDALRGLASVNLSNLSNIGNATKAAVSAANGGVPVAPAQQPGTGTMAPEYQTAANAAWNLSDAVKSAMSSIKSFLGVADGIKLLRTVFTKTAVAAKELVKQVAQLPLMLGSRLASSVKQATSSLSQFVGRLKKIALYRFIRSTIKNITAGFQEGMKNLYNYSTMIDGQFARSMNNLATSSLYLKNSLAAMASPIYEALAPAISFLVDKIVYLFNLVNQLFSRLGGKSTYTAAKKFETSWGDAADKAVGSAKSAAKELKRTILGFDELNVLNSPDTSGSGSGSGAGTGLDASSMFEEVEIDSSVSEFADKIKEAVAKQDWKGLGTTIGSKINEAVDAIDWAGIGTKFGGYVDGIIKSSYYTLKEINFTNIGSKIATFLNNAIKNVDWEYLGRYLVARVTSVLDVLYGFFNTFDFGELGTGLSDGIKGIFAEASEWLDGKEWDTFGGKLVQDLADFINGVDFSGIVNGMFSTLGSLLKAGTDLIGGILGEMYLGVSDWWDENIAGDDWESTGANILDAIQKGLGNVTTWAVKNIVDPLGKAFYGKDWDKKKQEIEDAIYEIFTWISEHSVISFAVENLDTVLTAYKTVKSAVENTVTEKVVDTSRGFLGILIEIRNKLNPTNSFEDLLKKLKEAKGETNLFKQAWQTMSDTLKPGSVFAQAFETTAKLVVDKLKEITKEGSKAEEKVKGVFGNTVDEVGKILNGDVTKKEITIGAKVNLSKGNFSSLDEYVGSLKKKDVNLKKGNYTSLDSYVGNLAKKNVNLAKGNYTTLDKYVGSLGTKKVNLGKGNYSTLDKYVGNLSTKSVTLGKNNWSTIDKYVGTLSPVKVNLTKGNFTSLEDWLMPSGAVGVTLAINTAKKKADGGIIDSRGIRNFAQGGVATKLGTALWDQIPRYANGGIHGSMFIAGERGAELVGHINGRSEVLNSSQLAQVMHRAVTAGMAQIGPYVTEIENRIVSATNAIVGANRATTEAMETSFPGNMVLDPQVVANIISDTATMGATKSDVTTDEIAEGVRQGMFDQNVRQSDLLKEQNELLRVIASKDTTVEVTAGSIINAISQKNWRDGKTNIQVGY